MNNEASYCVSPDDSIRWTPSPVGDYLFDLLVEVKTIDMLKANKIMEAIDELCIFRGFKVETVLKQCAPYDHNRVETSHLKIVENILQFPSVR